MMKTFFLASFFVVMFLASFNISLAATSCPSTPCSPGYVCNTAGNCVLPNVNTFTNPAGNGTFSDFMCNITSTLAQDVVPPIAVLMVLIVGFLYMTSAGDPQKSKMATKILGFTILGIVIALISPGIVSLFSDVVGSPLGASFSCSGNGVGSNIVTDAIIKLVNWVAWLMALMSVVMGLYAGFLYITSQGDAKRLSEAWKTFVFAIVGTAVAILAFSIISIVKIFL